MLLQPLGCLLGKFNMQKPLKSYKRPPKGKETRLPFFQHFSGGKLLIFRGVTSSFKYLS